MEINQEGFDKHYRNNWTNLKTGGQLSVNTTLEQPNEITSDVSGVL